jgi:hypothetical protein
MHRAGESIAGDSRKMAGGRLVRLVSDPIAGQPLPVINPDPAESAVAIEDEQGRCTM